MLVNFMNLQDITLACIKDSKRNSNNNLIGTLEGEWMKTIGLIGGMSWESTVEYYRLINEEVKSRLGGFHSAKCLLYSVKAPLFDTTYIHAMKAVDKAIS